MNPDMQCTLWPEGWWQSCCIAHDIGQMPDSGFIWCVAQTAPGATLAVVGAIIGTIMFFGLKLFGPVYRRIAGARNW